MPNSQPTISVVIPVYNGQRTIVDLLDSLKNQTLQPLEVIVVDNNSTDSTKGVIDNWQKKHHAYPLTLTTEIKQGRSCARNRGLSMAIGDYIAFFDADCVVHPEWIANATNLFGCHGFTVVGGVVKGFRPRNSIEKALHFLHCPRELTGIVCKNIDQWDIMRGDLETNNVLIKAQALKCVNGFSENAFFVTGEDFDLFLRLLRKGDKLLGLHKNLIVFHQHRSDLQAMVKQVFGYGYSFAECVATHFQHQLVLIGRQNSYAMPFPFAVWLRLSRAFVVLVALFIAAFFVPIYYLIAFAAPILVAFILLWRFRLQKEQMRVSFFEFFQVLLVALLHKLILSAGHIWGSLTFRIFCL